MPENGASYASLSAGHLANCKKLITMQKRHHCTDYKISNGCCCTANESYFKGFFLDSINSLETMYSIAARLIYKRGPYKLPAQL